MVSPDPSDPKLAHLDGLNLSRAWMLESVAAGLPKGDKRLPSIMATAEAHRQAGLAAVPGKHYARRSLAGELCRLSGDKARDFRLVAASG